MAACASALVFALRAMWDRVQLSNLLLFLPTRSTYDFDAPELIFVPSAAAGTSGVSSSSSLLLPPEIPCRFKPSASGSPLLLIALHGQSGDIYKSDFWFKPALCGALDPNVLAIEYPGYGLAPGVPSEWSVIEAVDRVASRFLAEAAGGHGPIEWERVCVCGRSLGSGPASELVSRRPNAGALMLVSPFTSVRDVAVHKSPPLLRPLVSAFLIDRFANGDKVRNFHGKLLLLHGRQDSLIPVSHSEALHASSPTLSKVFAIDEDGTHAALRGDQEVVAFIQEFAAAVRKGWRGRVRESGGVAATAVANITWSLPPAWRIERGGRSGTPGRVALRRFARRWTALRVASVITLALLAVRSNAPAPLRWAAAELCVFVAVAGSHLFPPLRLALVLGLCGFAMPALAWATGAISRRVAASTMLVLVVLCR